MKADRSTRPSRATRWVLTQHAIVRAQQRHYTYAELVYICAHGALLQRDGIRFYHMAADDLPRAHRARSFALRLVGTVVLAATEANVIITMYKPRHPWPRYRLTPPAPGTASAPP